MLNRQCRFVGQSDWHSYGDVSHLAAVRQHCSDKSDTTGPLSIEVRCESEPDSVSTFRVEGRIEWTVLNPRLGA